MIRICWRSKYTRYEGHGEWQSDSEREKLQAWIDNLAKDPYVGVEHWIEEADDVRQDA
jgi:hypothetical protein